MSATLTVGHYSASCIVADCADTAIEQGHVGGARPLELALASVATVKAGAISAPPSTSDAGPAAAASPSLLPKQEHEGQRLLDDCVAHSLAVSGSVDLPYALLAGPAQAQALTQAHAAMPAAAQGQSHALSAAPPAAAAAAAAAIIPALNAAAAELASAAAATAAAAPALAADAALPRTESSATISAAMRAGKTAAANAAAAAAESALRGRIARALGPLLRQRAVAAGGIVCLPELALVPSGSSGGGSTSPPSLSPPGGGSGAASRPQAAQQRSASPTPGFFASGAGVTLVEVGSSGAGSSSSSSSGAAGFAPGSANAGSAGTPATAELAFLVPPLPAAAAAAVSSASELGVLPCSASRLLASGSGVQLVRPAACPASCEGVIFKETPLRVRPAGGGQAASAAESAAAPAAASKDAKDVKLGKRPRGSDVAAAAKAGAAASAAAATSGTASGIPADTGVLSGPLFPVAYSVPLATKLDWSELIWGPYGVTIRGVHYPLHGMVVRPNTHVLRPHPATGLPALAAPLAVDRSASFG